MNIRQVITLQQNGNNRFYNNVIKQYKKKNFNTIFCKKKDTRDNKRS